MNPRKRRGAVLLILTAVGAVAVFLGVLTYVASVGSQVGPMVTVLRFTQDVKAYTPIQSGMVETAEVPQRWVSAGAVSDPRATTGLVAAATYKKGSMVQEGMLISRPGVQPGFREVAIMVDAETGVAGKVSSGDHVDIIATIAGDDLAPPRSELWVANALVLNVGMPEDTEKQGSDGNYTSGKGIPVTFALSTPDALRLAYGESFSVKLRLALRGAGDDTLIPDSDRVFALGGN